MGGVSSEIAAMAQLLSKSICSRVSLISSSLPAVCLHCNELHQKDATDKVSQSSHGLCAEYKPIQHSSGLFADHYSLSPLPSDIFWLEPVPNVRPALCLVQWDREGYFLCEPTPKYTVSNNRSESSAHLCSHDKSPMQADATNISLSVYSRQEVYRTVRHVHSSNFKGCICVCVWLGAEFWRGGGKFPHCPIATRPAGKASRMYCGLQKR